MKDRLQPEAVPSKNQEILDQLTHEFGLSRFNPIFAGERRVPLFRCKTDVGRGMVVKIGSGGDEQRNEVVNNITGHKAIKKLGAYDILPTDLIIKDYKDTPVIIMTDLGDNFGDQVKSRDLNAYEIFISQMPKIYGDSIHEVPEGQNSGLNVVKDMLYEWYGKLVAKGALTSDVLEKN